MSNTKKMLFSEDNKYSNRTLEILSIIYKEIEANVLLITIFVAFLNNDEKNILDRSNIFSLLNKVINSKALYEKLMNLYNEVKEVKKYNIY